MVLMSLELLVKLLFAERTTGSYNGLDDFPVEPRRSTLYQGMSKKIDIVSRYVKKDQRCIQVCQKRLTLYPGTSEAKFDTELNKIFPQDPFPHHFCLFQPCLLGILPEQGGIDAIVSQVSGQVLKPPSRITSRITSMVQDHILPFYNQVSEAKFSHTCRTVNIA